MKLRVHQIVYGTIANGPGKRIAIWVQGCTLGCPGCFNPNTHTTKAGQAMKIEVGDLIHSLETHLGDPSIEGITISGGEPLQQWKAVEQLLTWVKSTRWTSVVFTGYTPDEIQRMPLNDELSTLVDVVIAGRYQKENRQANRLIGSTNKRMIFNSSAYTPEDFETIPPAEIRISLGGKITLSGIDPLKVGA